MKTIALIQGAYFLTTGIWPLVHIGSFLKVTGPKKDIWLVKTVGVVISAIGAALIVAGVRGEITPATVFLAMGSAAGLGGIDVVYVVKRVISKVYLYDALAEAVLILLWIVVM